MENHAQAPIINYNFASERPRFTRGRRFIAGLATGAAVLGIAGCATESNEGNMNAHNAITAPAVPGLESNNSIEVTDKQMETMSEEAYWQLDNEPRVNHFISRIDEWRDGAWDNMMPVLTPAEAAVINNNLPTDKRAYTSQDILNAYAIDIFDASTQGSSPAKITQGRKMLSVIVSPDNPNFEDLSEMIGNGLGAIKTVEKNVGPEYPLLQNVNFRGINIGAAGARIIKAEDISTAKGATGYSLYVLTTAPEGQIWQYTTQYSLDDPTLAGDIATAIKHSHS